MKKNGKERVIRRKEAGITLVALVITIVIIVILASVTIAGTFGENGIIRQAELARDLATNSTIKENEDMNSLMDEYTNIMSGDGEVPEPPKDETPPTVEIVVGEVTETSIAITVNATDDSGEIAKYVYHINGKEPQESTTNTYKFTGLTAETEYTIKVEAFDKANNKGEKTISASTKKKDTIADIIGGDKVKDNTEIEDDLGNKVWIPGGFGVAPDSGTKVEEGIVIQDAKGNQFVWIPVGEYKVSTSINSTGKLTNNLSRRTFTSSKSTTVTGDNVIESYYYGEGDSRSVASGTIGAFKTSATSKGGFYIGRYEQGTGNVCKKNVEPYVNVTRDTANTKAKAMYSNNSYVKSELISSYAWDTALNFICQTNSAGYTLATTTSSSYGNINTSTPTKTGEYTVNGKVVDKYSNIYDFLGNRYEWTTEFYSSSNNPCVIRGGSYRTSNNYAATRRNLNTSSSFDYISFRLQLYVKD